MKLQQQSMARTAALSLTLSFAAGTVGASSSDADALTAADATGMIRTYIAGGNLDTGNPFFQALGTNGR
jgi:ABC-type sugar transport system substrate-binding protein